MGARSCPECGGAVIEIEIASGETPLVMRSCSKCDAREWSADGRGIDLTTALRELSDSGGGKRRRD
jgi:endogenous inhibitor of DNA gyrase (YacG/DUF329 family)